MGDIDTIHRKCIQAIRRNHGLDFVVDDVQATSAITSLRGNLERALDSLSEELYAKPTHFLLELIQNADDNQYATGVGPALSIALHEQERTLVIRCNEVGFAENNVRAICSIGKSTKKGQNGYIGEKGIGFKSVFKVADIVYILSNGYRFKFDKNEELGMIAPIWTNDYSPEPGWTTMLLHLSHTVDIHELRENLNKIEASLLLFLRKLRKIELNVGGPTQIYTRHDGQHGIVRLDHPCGPSIQYLKTRYTVRSMPEDKKRENVSDSEVVLGFPLANDHSPVIKAQELHAFLPVRSYGFKFLIQADFLLAANREDILSDRPWNQRLRDSIATAFCAAVPELQAIPNLKYTWFRYIPSNISDSFLRPVRHSILNQLGTMAVIECSDGIARKSDAVLACPPQYADSDGRPLISERYLSSCRQYLPPMYSGDVLSTLRHIGVEDMDEDSFISGLEAMGRSHAFQSQSSSWLEHTCSALLGIMRGWSSPWAFRIKQLPIVPLTDGSWVSSASEAVFFDAGLGDVPTDLGIRLVKRMKVSSDHYRLLEKLGIKEASSAQVIARITEVHQGTGFDRSHAKHALLHARFVYLHRHSARFFTSKLRILGQGGFTVAGQEAYMNHPRHRGLRLDSFLSTATFIDSGYYQSHPGIDYESWLDWIHKELGVHIAPRITTRSLSSEFATFLNRANTTDILSVLKEYWSDWEASQNISRNQSILGALRTLMVDASDGNKHRLSETFRDVALSDRFPDLPFLPLENPADSAWDFLGHLGVTSRPDGVLYLKRLIALSSRSGDEVSREEVRECYRQLEARFDEGANKDAIREAFRTHSLVFIYPKDFLQLGGTWVALRDVVWSGPACMRTKFALEPLYSHQERFWKGKIQVPDCPEDIVLQEFRAVISEWRNKPLDEDIHTHVCDLLQLAADIVSHMKPPNRPTLGWVSLLSKEPIFPVMGVNDEITLVGLGETFYVPDVSRELEELFGGHVPLLYLSQDMFIRDLGPLLNLEAFGELLYLKESVHERVEKTGQEVPDVSSSETYQKRVPFIARLFGAVAPKTLVKDKGHLISKLGDTGFYQVDSIRYTYSLDETELAKEEEVSIEVTDSRIKVYMTEALEGGLDVVMCSRLSRLLGIDYDKLLLVLTLPLGAVDQYLKQQGIHEYYDRALTEEQDTSWMPLHGSATTSNPGPSSFTASSLSNSTEHQELLPPLTVAKDFQNMLRERIEKIEYMVSAGSLSLDLNGLHLLGSSFQAMSISSPLSYGTGSLASKEIELRKIILPVSGSIPVTTYNSTLPRDPQAMTGIVGEYMMYELLKGKLPSFGLQNWTSELRGEVHNYTSYPGSSYTDFTYEDQQGWFTEYLFGFATKESWEEFGWWPTYHIEVKSTAYSPNTDFHMSSRQMNTAAQMAIRDMSQPPRNIFVLARLSHMDTDSPEYQFIADPWTQISEGRITVSKEVWMGLSADR